jgi:hypothetical protein
VILAAFALAWAAPAAADEASVRLVRTYVEGERRSYRVESDFQSELRLLGLGTWMPTRWEARYDFTVEATALREKAAELRYRRSGVTYEWDDFLSTPAGKRQEPYGWDLRLSLSRQNKLMGPPRPFAGPEPTLRLPKVTQRARGHGARPLLQYIDSFMGGVYELCARLGSLETALDLGPPLPEEAVAPGDTWEANLQYQPHWLQGFRDTAVLPIPTKFISVGAVETGGVSAYRIRSHSVLQVDMADFLNAAHLTRSGQTTIVRVPVRVEMEAEFDLDRATLRTISARSKATGEFRVFSSEFEDEPFADERFRAESRMRGVAVR